MMPALFQTQFYGLGIHPKIEETKTPLQNLYSSAGERNNNKTNQSVVENAGKPQVPWKEKKNRSEGIGTMVVPWVQEPRHGVR